jgi:hypothetical protein
METELETKNEETQTVPSEKSARKTVLTVVLTTIATLAVLGISYYAYIQYANFSKKADEKPAEKAPEKTTEEKKAENQVPSGFQKVTLNGVDVYYPVSWGTLTTRHITEEISGNFPGMEFEGDSAYAEKPRKSITVMNESSILNAKQDYVNTINNLLLKVYNEKKLNAEDFFAGESYYLPVINAGTDPYNPRYVESANGKWRGLWYLGTQGQQVNCNPNFIALLYNKEVNKVISFVDNVQSASSSAVEKEVYDLLNGNERGVEANANYKIKTYMQSAYASDTAVKNEINNYALKVIEYLK